MDIRKLGMRKMTREEVISQNAPDRALVIIGNKVYDVTTYAKTHPGGMMTLLNYAGKDATGAFDKVGHSMYAKNTMKGLVYAELAEPKNTAPSPSVNSQNGTPRGSDFSVRTPASAAAKASSSESARKFNSPAPALTTPPSVPTSIFQPNLKAIDKNSKVGNGHINGHSDSIHAMLPDLSELQQPNSMSSPRRPDRSGAFSPLSPLPPAEPATSYVNHYAANEPTLKADQYNRASSQDPEFPPGGRDSPSSLQQNGGEYLDCAGSNDSRVNSLSPTPSDFMAESGSSTPREDSNSKRPLQSPRNRVQKALFKMKCAKVQRAQHFTMKKDLVLASPREEELQAPPAAPEQPPAAPAPANYSAPAMSAAPTLPPNEPSNTKAPTPNGYTLTPPAVTSAAAAAPSPDCGNDCDSCPNKDTCASRPAVTPPPVITSTPPVAAIPPPVPIVAPASAVRPEAKRPPQTEGWPQRSMPSSTSRRPMSSYTIGEPAPPPRDSSPPPTEEEHEAAKPVRPAVERAPAPAAALPKLSKAPPPTPAKAAVADEGPAGACPHLNGSMSASSSVASRAKTLPSAGGGCPFSSMIAAMAGDEGGGGGRLSPPTGSGKGSKPAPSKEANGTSADGEKDGAGGVGGGKKGADKYADGVAEAAPEVPAEGSSKKLTKQPSFGRSSMAPKSVATFSQHSGSSATAMTRGSGGSGKRGRRKVLRSKAPHCDMAQLAKYVPVIKGSWAKVVRSMSWDALGNLLYQTLFDEAEELRGMFFNLTQAQSIRFVDMLSSIFDFCHSPEKMHEKMESMGAMHHSRGVQTEHMTIMQKVILSMLSQCLRQEFTTPVREAWGFLWEFLTRSMTQTLETFGGHSSIVQDSWDAVLSKFSNLEVGGFLYDTLFELAPNLQSLFKRPKDVIALKFVEMISMLVSFSGDKERMRTNITWLGFRHVRYGVRPHHIPIMGQVLMAVLEKALAAEWTEAMATAWGELWTQTCDMMRRAIDDGEQKGSAVIEAWAEVRRRTTATGFGGMVYTKLLKYTTGTGATDFAENLSEYRSSHRDGGGGGGGGGKQYDKHADITGSDALGAECWDLMSVLTDKLYDPDEQIEVLTVRGAHYFEMGIKSADLTAMGQAIHDSVQEALGPGATPKTSEAVRWLWQVACISLGKAVKNAEDKHWETVQTDWAFVKESVESQAIGEAFYTELGEAAPEMIHLFARPKNIQSNLFVLHLDALIAMAREPAKLIEDVRAMTIRHIKYGAKPEDVGPFAATFIEALSRLMGERWSDRSREAWGALWELLTTCMARCLRAGSSPITIALVQGDLRALKVAITAMPRAQREECLLKIEINGAVESPLYWAVHDGHVELARFMLRDLLTIRADRDRYYYGLDALMAMHGDLVTVLCRKAPALLDELFDGLLWTSKSASTTEEGIIRVNYYVRDLYGDPRKVPRVWDGPLAVLCLEGPINSFLHPVVLKVLHVKWHLFGRALFLLMEGWYSGLLLLFMLGFIVLHDSCRAAPVRTAAGALAGLTLAMQLGIIVRQFRAGQVQRAAGSSRGTGTALPHWLRNAWNVNRMASMILIVLGAAGELCYAGPGRDGLDPVADPIGTDFTDVVVAIAGVLLWMGMLEILTLSTRLSAFTYSISVLAADMARNFIVIGVLLLSFGSALVVVERAVAAAGGEGIPGFETLGDAIMSLISLIIVLSTPMIEGADAFAIVALVAFACLANIGMLNILIAQLTLSFESISRDKRAFAMAHRARVCVEMEDLLPQRYRQRLFDGLGFDKPLEFDRGDVGVAGGLQALESVWSVRADPRFVPDRIRRYPGEADKDSPWPDEDED